MLGSVAALSALSYAGAYLVRFDFQWPDAYQRTFLLTVGPLVALRCAAAWFFDLHGRQWRYTGTRDLVAVVLATGVTTVLFWVVSSVLPVQPRVPRSVFLIDLIVAAYLLGGTRVLYRMSHEWARDWRWRDRTRERVLIVGAGSAGELLCQDIQRHPEFGRRVVGFLDDDAGKIGTRLHGIPVLGRTADAPALVERHAVGNVVIAIPSGRPADLRRIVKVCEQLDIGLSVLPYSREVLRGQVQLSQIRDLRMEDLLGREPITIATPDLERDLRHRSVLITGAAGSIGSELARQIAACGPERLVVFDQSETDLFYLELELRERHPELPIVPVVGDILDQDRVGKLFAHHRPSHVFHAAAYKHVPLMEGNPSEAVWNNVIGTQRVGEAAGRHGAEKFVLISTDKAARPHNVMGATKRVAELVTLALADRYRDTSYVGVRFGNVLGSRGSVVPVFQRQIEAGRPLTVTHPDATRYFMTIAEAVQLVLQASVLPEARGCIVMLDMGEPIRILDLAHTMLRLAGLRPNDHERIRIIGLRPGESLHEELTGRGEEITSTKHPRVFVVRGPVLPAVPAVLDRLQAWQNDGRDPEAVWQWCRLGSEPARGRVPRVQSA